MALKNDLQCSYDGVCIYITISAKPTILTRIILSLVNIFLLGMIVLFLMEDVAIAALAFCAFEFFVFKYTLWNLFGKEKIIINTRSLSFQLHYGIFTTPSKTTVLNKRILLGPYDEIVQDDQKLLKILVQSYNEHNLPTLIFQSVLFIISSDFERVALLLHQLYLDEMVEEIGMPQIYLN